MAFLEPSRALAVSCLGLAALAAFLALGAPFFVVASLVLMAVPGASCAPSCAAGANFWTACQMRVTAVLRSVNFLTGFRSSKGATPAKLFQISARRAVGQSFASFASSFWLAKGIAPSTLHATLPWGLAGFAASVITGVMFIAGQPDQYFYNKAFMLKVVFLALMGANAALFYRREFAGVLTLGPHEDAPRSTKAIAAASLVFFVAVTLCGRMLTFFRPPY